MKLFAYGTLRKNFSNNYILATENAKFLEDDAIENFKMISMQAFPALVKVESGLVQGEVYEISDNCLKYCDRLEGYPNFYQREIVKTKNGHDVWVYYLPFIEEGDWKTYYDKSRLEFCCKCGKQTNRNNPCKGNCGTYLCSDCYSKTNVCEECQFEANVGDEEVIEDGG